RCDAMSGQVVGDVSQPRRGLIAVTFRYFDDHDVLGLAQERQRILDGATGLAHILPGDSHSPGRECRYASRHDQNRPALRIKLPGSRDRNGSRLARALPMMTRSAARASRATTSA